MRTPGSSSTAADLRGGLSLAPAWPGPHVQTLVLPARGLYAAVRGHGQGVRGEVSLTAAVRAMRRAAERLDPSTGVFAAAEAVLCSADAELRTLCARQRAYAELSASVALVVVAGAAAAFAHAGDARAMCLREGALCLASPGTAGALGGDGASDMRVDGLALEDGDAIWISSSGRGLAVEPGALRLPADPADDELVLDVGARGGVFVVDARGRAASK